MLPIRRLCFLYAGYASYTRPEILHLRRVEVVLQIPNGHLSELGTGVPERVARRLVDAEDLAGLRPSGNGRFPNERSSSPAVADFDVDP